MSTNAGSPVEGDATGGIIPYKNPAALIAYYCGVFSLIPILGLFVGVPGVVLGVVGLRKRRANRVIKGAVHAWSGIVFGVVTTLLWGGLIALAIIAGIRS